MQSNLRRRNEDTPQSKRGSFRDALKWWTFIISFICYTAGRFRSHMFLINDVADDALRAPTTEMLSKISAIIFMITLALSLILGILTVPKWQGFLSLTIVLWA